MLCLLRFAAILSLAGCQRSGERVVVYCAQDEDFATELFKDYRGVSGREVAAKFDTEANKSVGLATALRLEIARPRCDVHWNNEILATIQLARAGVYEPYRSPMADSYPAWTRPADGTYQAFAARARVLIVNTDVVPRAKWPQSVLDLTHPAWKGQVVIAKPQFGTTATQAACLFEVLGPDAARTFYCRLATNGVRVVAGNKQSATEVSAGRAMVGLTDSDDALIEVHAGKPVAIVFPDRVKNAQFPRLGTLYIPNTVAVVKGSPNPKAARELVDYLLRPETERRLAGGGGFQIPLNPNVSADLPPALLTPAQGRAMSVDFERAADLWDESQAFLRDEFAR